MHANFLRLAFFFFVLFALLSLYLGYITAGWGPKLLASPHNRRLALLEASIERGTICDRRGEVLARSVKQGDRFVRQYPLAADTFHLLGYVSDRYGRSGLESAFDLQLLGLEGSNSWRYWWAHWRGRPYRGNDVVLTIDAGLQRTAARFLAGRSGAVVALDPRNGEILALASSPAPDPRDLPALLESGDKDGRGVLFNRATQGAYPPGSAFKVITACAAVAAGVLTPEREFQCQGVLQLPGLTLNDTRAHGRVNFNAALAYSCNVTFATLGLETGGKNIYETAVNFGFTRELPLELPYRPGTLADKIKLEKNRNELAETAIGQGELLVSPLQMALVAAAIAMEGRIMQPCLWREVRSPEGKLLMRNQPRLLWEATTAEAASRVKRAMIDVVRYGTGKAAALPGVTVAGKTGTAQNPRGEPHAWFIGFAPAENPRIAVAVVIENGGSGGAVAAPLARAIIAQALNTNEGR